MAAVNEGRLDTATEQARIAAVMKPVVATNRLTVASSTRRIRGSLRLFIRNATGSTPAFAAMMSICPLARIAAPSQ